jgi:UDP-glucuronate decarboxylase
MVNWITDNLATAPHSSAGDVPDALLVDVRAMVDRGGNRAEQLRGYVQAAVEGLGSGRRVLICCDHGISRSNAVAAAVLSRHEGVGFDEAVQRVLSATGAAEIRLDVLEAVRAAVQAVSVRTGNDSRTWLITGGSGYLGAALAAACPAGVELVAPSRGELDLLAGAAAIDLWVKRHGVSRILHFASPRVSNTNTAFGQSVTMLRNVLDACATNGIPVFLPCRWEVYAGYRGSRIQADEWTALRPGGVLGETKFLGEILVRQFRQREGVQFTLLRSGLVYGGRSAPNFLRSLVKKASAGQSLVTHRYENGPPLLDMISLDDWLSAAWALLVAGEPGVFHCGAGLISTSDVARIVADTFGAGAEPVQVDISGQAAAVELNSEKLGRILGWRAEVDPHAGISAYVKKAAVGLEETGR